MPEGVLAMGWLVFVSLSAVSCNNEVTGPSGLDDDLPAASSPLGPSVGVWVSGRELYSRPDSGPAWANLTQDAQQACRTPNLSDQEDQNDVCLLGKALVYARTGQPQYRDEVIAALDGLTRSGRYRGRALSLGRGLPAVVVAADLIDLAAANPDLDARFRSFIRELLHTPTWGGPIDLVDCHERRPNNWGNHCGAARAAVAAYLRDSAEMARIAQVFKGFLGDRASYAGFEYGELDWQCDASQPVGINPSGCVREGRVLDGVIPDDQRRSGGFTWPPPRENYVYESLQGALVEAVILNRAGYPAFDWENRALLRAFKWLHEQAQYPALGDDVWQMHLVNHYYRANLPAPLPTRPGKNMGWTDWTHRP